MVTAHPHDNLFQAVPKLGIPSMLESYLRHDVFLDKDFEGEGLWNRYLDDKDPNGLLSTMMLKCLLVPLFTRSRRELPLPIVFYLPVPLEQMCCSSVVCVVGGGGGRKRG